ncbi:hypothetical protein [Kitasatospora sp. NPDC004289]
MSNSATLLLLRDGEGAEASARHCLELIATRSTGERPLVIAPQASADLAAALLMRDELDGAAEALGSVLSLPREWRGAGVAGRVNSIRGELVSSTFRNAPLARELVEQIEDFTLLSAPQILGSAPVRLCIDPGPR